MTDKVTLTSLANLQNETTAVSAINANMVAITTAMDNTLSRDGTSPNTMGAALDMNSNQIINLPSPSTDSSPLRFSDLNDFLGGAVTFSNLPTGGSIDSILTKNSSTDYDASWTNTITSPTITSPTITGPTSNLVSRTITGTTDTITSSFNKYLNTYTNAGTKAVTLNVLAAKGWVIVQNNGAGTATVTPSSGTINGSASLAVAFQDSYLITSDGTNQQAFQLGLWATETNDIFFNNRLALYTSTAGIPVNITGNGNVSLSNYTGAASIVSNYASNHLGSNNFALSVTSQAPGSSATTAGGSSDGAILASAQQTSYLTSSVDAEIDTIWTTNYQGVNATGNAITGTIIKRANGSSQPANQGQAIELQTELVNGSGSGTGTIALQHSHLGQLETSNSKYGFGGSLEAHVGAWDTALLTDSHDLSAGTAGTAPSWNYVFRSRTERSDTNQFFGITGSGHTSGSGRIASGKAGSTITARAQFNNNTAVPSAAQTGVIIYGVGVDGSNVGLELAAYGDTQFPFLSFMKAGGTLASRTTIGNANSIGQMTFGGYDGTNFDQTGALFTAVATEAWTSGAHGSKFDFYTTPNTTTSTAVAFSINQDKSISSVGAATILNGTAVPAGGTTGAGYKLSSVSNLGIFFGSGAPTLSAAQGSLYIRTDGSSSSTRLYVNSNGSTTWVNITSAS